MNSISLMAGALLALAAPPAARAIAYADALAVAEQRSPALAAQALQLEAARAARPAAGALPDPKLGLGLQNLPVDGLGHAGREPMTMLGIGLMQEVPNRGKREARVQLAEARAEREQALLGVQRQQLRQALGLAWIAAQAAERRERLLDGLRAENARLQATLPARIAGGSVAPAELLAAREQALALDDRRDTLRRDAQRARAALRRWLGERADETLEGTPPPPARTAAQLREMLDRHAELAVHPAQRAMAAAALREAEAEARGDWSWEVGYARRGAGLADMVSVRLSFELPWQRSQRQEPLIRARRLEMQRAEADQDEARRRQLQGVDEAVAELQALDAQLDRLRAQGLGLVAERAALALSRYEAGSAAIDGVFAARAQLLEAQLRQVELEARRDELRLGLDTLIAD